MIKQLYEERMFSWDLAKLLELGIDEKWLRSTKIEPQQARELVKGLLYLREWAESAGANEWTKESSS